MNLHIQIQTRSDNNNRTMQTTKANSKYQKRTAKHKQLKEDEANSWTDK